MNLAEIAARRTTTWTPGQDGEKIYVGLEHIIPYGLRLAGTGLSSDVSSGKMRFEAGDILFGKLRPYFRKVVRPSFAGVCSTDIWALYSVDPAKVDQSFLHWVVADAAFSEFANSAETGTRMPRASWQWVGTYEVTLPPIEEQLAIASVLDTLEGRISSARRLRELLAATAQCIVSTAPEYCTVGDLASAQRQQWYPDRNPGDIVDHYSLPAFDSGQEPERVRAGEIASNKLLVRTSSVLFSRLNPDTNRTWLCVPHSEVAVSVCSTEYAVLLPGDTSVGMLWAALSSGEVGEQLAAATTGTSASHQRISEEAVLSATVPDPRSLGEGQRDVAEAAVQAYLERGRELRMLREMREYLLPRLLSGELRVSEANIETGVA